MVTIVCKLYKASKQAQRLIDVELRGDIAEEQLVTECKKRIHAAFFGSRLSLKNARTIISDFKKVSKNRENVAELMLHYVECGVEYTSMYGDINEAFYYSIESMFSDFVRVLNNLDSEAYYSPNRQHGYISSWSIPSLRAAPRFPPIGRGHTEDQSADSRSRYFP